MSTPEEIRGEAAETEAGETQRAQRPVDQPMNVAMAVQQLRGLVCGLGAGLLGVSLVLSAFIYKQNRNLTGAINARQRQISQMSANQQQVTFVIDELVRYSTGKPELMALFAKHGMQFTPKSGGPAAAPEPSH